MVEGLENRPKSHVFVNVFFPQFFKVTNLLHLRTWSASQCIGARGREIGTKIANYVIKVVEVIAKLLGVSIFPGDFARASAECSIFGVSLVESGSKEILGCKVEGGKTPSALTCFFSLGGALDIGSSTGKRNQDDVTKSSSRGCIFWVKNVL
eukprot:GHVP01005666.1.p1 GENE.GHVP01005666.1~~GHVP01005666.1.p1  ORF type:complete len:152 (-),score=17.63 GHVP01005666.1:407-862(-)